MGCNIARDWEKWCNVALNCGKCAAILHEAVAILNTGNGCHD